MTCNMERINGRTCKEREALCSSPIECSGSGAETDAAIRLHRAMNAPIERPLPVEYAGAEPIEPPMSWKQFYVILALVFGFAFGAQALCNWLTP